MGHHLKDNSIVLSLLTFESNQTGWQSDQGESGGGCKDASRGGLVNI